MYMSVAVVLAACDQAHCHASWQGTEHARVCAHLKSMCLQLMLSLLYITTM